MPELDESEILDGMRGWTGSQRAFIGVADGAAPRRVLDVGWYDTGLDEHEGAFCLVRAGSALEDLVGEVVRFQRQRFVGHVYCVGGAALSTDVALSRPTFLRFAPLSDETFRGIVQAIAR